MSRGRSGWLGGHLVPLVVAAVFLLPLLWMATASLRGPGLAPPTSVEWLPPSATAGNYGAVFELLPFGRYLLNSLAVVALAVPLTIVTASMAGFAMALLERRTRGALMVLWQLSRPSRSRAGVMATVNQPSLSRLRISPHS